MSIVEIPLDQEAPELTEVEQEEVEPEVVEKKTPGRGRGRPKGAPNKTKKEPQPKKTRELSPASPVVAPKPKAKRKTAPVEKKEIKKKKRIVYESSSEEEGVPTQDTRTNDMQQIAGEVLSLLSSQRANQREQRRNRYAGWFANTNM